MDTVLRKALTHFLEKIDPLVEDLLLVELDWGPWQPPLISEPFTIPFQGANWPVVFSDSELVLRRALCESPSGRAILVVPQKEGYQPPRDIQARGARYAVPPLSLQHRLYALTGREWPAQVGYADWRPVIERHFDALVDQTSAEGTQWLNVTPTDLERMLVAAAFGLTVTGHTAPELLATLVKSPSTALSADLELALLQGQLHIHQVPGSEVLLWAAREPGRAEQLIRTGVMMGAERWANFVPTWGQLHNLRAVLVNERKMSDDDAKDTVITVATETLPHLHHQTRKTLVQQAERELGAVLPATAYNPWFPGALERAIGEIASQIALHNLDATSRVPQVQGHLFAPQFASQLATLETMAALLCAWETEKPRLAALDNVATWATWYAQAGAQLDLEALKLMASQQQGTGLGEAVQRLLQDHWRWRDQANAQFAQIFLAQYEAALHDRDAGVFGLHRVLEWVVKPQLQQQRRVLLLVIDGMGWATFWHVLAQWQKQTPPVYARDMRSALALLPSITSVSRKALFLGALPTDHLDSEETYEQKARVQEDAALQAACPDYTTRLFNKSNLNDGQEVANVLRFYGADLVAVILNAVDDDLKSVTTTVRLPRLEDLGPLVNLVQTALETNWQVIITADHGHTWHRDKALRRGSIVPGGGERFAPSARGAPIPPGALITEDALIVRLQAEHAMLLLTASGAYYGHGPRRGYHGGVSLEEVVVPCVSLTLQKPAVEHTGDGVSKGEAAQSIPPKADAPAGLLLTLSDGRVVSPALPFTLSPVEVRLLQALARHDEVSEDELKTLSGSRRVAGPLAALREKLAAEGLDWIEERGTGAGGTIYRLRTELL